MKARSRLYESVAANHGTFAGFAAIVLALAACSATPHGDVTQAGGTLGTAGEATNGGQGTASGGRGATAGTTSEGGIFGGGAGGAAGGGAGAGGAPSATGGSRAQGGSEGGAGAASGAASGAAGGGVAGAAGAGAGASGNAGGGGGGESTFLHPGLLHSEDDFARMKAKVAAAAEPWKSGYDRLLQNGHAALGWVPRPAAVVYRGADGTHAENYPQLYNDAAAAYALALRWKISDDSAYAEKAVQILDAWARTLTGIEGTSDKFLAAGLYGFQLANAAELMRGYGGWATADFTRFQQMMKRVFYPMNHDFLVRHNGACVTHYWANWDLCNMNSVLAIGVLTDDRALYDEAVQYFKSGPGNGSINNAVYFVHPGNLGQWQESGRDQGHNTLGIGLMGPFCEMAWKQGDDLYAYAESRFFAGAQYVARYNLGNAVPYEPYNNCDDVNQTVISENARGNLRPIWELVYNHYVNRRGMTAPDIAAAAAQVRPEGGGGDYGPNSGGYDQLGYGSLVFSLGGI